MRFSSTLSAIALDLGLHADPAVPQQVSVVFETTDPAGVGEFWQRVFDYVPGDGIGLVDPLRRDPAIRLRLSTRFATGLWSARVALSTRQ